MKAEKRETGDFFFPQVEDILLTNLWIFHHFKRTVSCLSVNQYTGRWELAKSLSWLPFLIVWHSLILVSCFDWKSYKHLISNKLRWNITHITASSYCNLQCTQIWWIVSAVNCWTPVTFDLCLPTQRYGWRKTLTFLFPPRFLFPEYTKKQLSRLSISSHTGVNYCTFEPYDIHYGEHYFCECAA